MGELPPPPPMYTCNGPVSSLCAAPEIGALVAGDTSGCVHVIDSETGERRYEFSCGEDAVVAVGFAPEIPAVISADGSMSRNVSRVVVWDVAGAVRAEMNYGNFVTALTYAPELHAVITGDGHFAQENPSGQVILWNVDSLEQHRRLSCRGPVTSVAWDSARGLILSADRAKCLRTWKAESGEMLSQLEMDSNAIPWCLAAPAYEASDFYAYALCNFKGNWAEMRLSDCEEGNVHLAVHFESAILSLAFLPEARVVACGSRSGEVIIFDFEARVTRKTLQAPSAVNALVFNPVKGELVAGDKKGTISSWPLALVLSD